MGTPLKQMLHSACTGGQILHLVGEKFGALPLLGTTVLKQADDERSCSAAEADDGESEFPVLELGAVFREGFLGAAGERQGEQYQAASRCHERGSQ
jgi:hypothetical protein